MGSCWLAGCVSSFMYLGGSTNAVLCTTCQNTTLLTLHSVQKGKKKRGSDQQDEQHAMSPLTKHHG